MNTTELNVKVCVHVFPRVRVYSFTKFSKGTQNRLSLEFLCTVYSNKHSNEHIPGLSKYLLAGCIHKTYLLVSHSLHKIVFKKYVKVLISFIQKTFTLCLSNVGKHYTRLQGLKKKKQKQYPCTRSSKFNRGDRNI